MSVSPDSVTVHVPASTSNCGAGFDTLGLAFKLYNHVTLRRTSGDIRPGGPGDERATAMVASAAAAYFAATGHAPFGFVFSIEGDVPPARGLGSSITVRAGVVAGLNALTGDRLPRSRLVAILTALEGHPDNAAAGVLGGFCVPRTNPADGTYLDCVRFEVPAELAFVVASPLVEILTKESRGALPSTLPYFDAVRSINSAAYLVAVMASRDYDKLRHVAGDFMHEPYRLPKIPGAQAALMAGKSAGALTGWLSGSGSSVLCVCRREEAAVVLGAMRGAFTTVGLACEGRILEADNAGLRVN